MIGGRVLDSSCLTAFATQASVYAAALVWTSVQENIVLVLPSTAVAAGWSRLEDKQRPVLEVLLGLPTAVVDELTTARARVVGDLAEHVVADDVAVAHAAACALERGWPLVTGEPERYRWFGGGLTVEDLP